MILGRRWRKIKINTRKTIIWIVNRRIETGRTKAYQKTKTGIRKRKNEEKANELTETNKDQIKLKDSSPKLKDSSPKLKNNGKGFLNSCNTKPLDVLKTSSNNPTGEGNLGKRKELEINGISHGESFPVSYNDHAAALLYLSGD